MQKEWQEGIQYSYAVMRFLRSWKVEEDKELCVGKTSLAWQLINPYLHLLPGLMLDAISSFLCHCRHSNRPFQPYRLGCCRGCYCRSSALFFIRQEEEFT